MGMWSALQHSATPVNSSRQSQCHGGFRGRAMTVMHQANMRLHTTFMDRTGSRVLFLCTEQEQEEEQEQEQEQEHKQEQEHECQLSDWSDWTTCNISIGSCIQTRSRSVLTTAALRSDCANSTETLICSPELCCMLLLRARVS